MQFSFKAREASGTVSEGVIDSTDRFFAAKELRLRGQTPISITPVLSRSSSGVSIFEKMMSQITLREKIIFINNLSGMLSAGLPLARSLEVEKKQTINNEFKEVIGSLLSVINQGGALSDAMQKHPVVFSQLFVSMVRAGEESGNLAWTLKEIGMNLEKSYALTRKIKGALVYPVVIFSILVIVGILMLIFVIPTLTKIFKDLGAKLPVTTQFIVSLSDGMAAHPFVVLFILVAIILGVLYALRSRKVLDALDIFVLRLPVVGTIAKEVNVARTSRTLSSLLRSGVEMTKALSITKDVVQNKMYKAVMERAIVAVQKGDTLSSVFKKEEYLYTPMVGEMVAVGEETGALTQMFSDVATFYEDEVDAKTKNLSTIIEPAIMVVVGVAVGFFAISVISPMYSLMSNIS